MTAGLMRCGACESNNEKLSVSWWDDMWTQEQTHWRAGENTLEPPFAGNLKYLADATGAEVVCAGKRAFVPLCGDSSVVTYLAEKGMDVVGLEGSPLAVEKLRAKVSALSEEAQQRVTIVAEDFFAYDGEAFDLIYDRASYVAIDPAMREAYAAVMTKVSKPGTVYFFEGIMRPDVALTVGPPHHLPDTLLPTLFPSPAWTVSPDAATVSDPNAIDAADTQMMRPPWVMFRAAITRVA